MGIGIGLGCAEFPFSGAAAYWRWIDMCEAGGVDSIWQTDRIVNRQPFLESMTTMAALAGRTRRMKFGMNVVSLAFRDPVLLAKQCATIDMLSDGRFTLSTAECLGSCGTAPVIMVNDAWQECVKPGDVGKLLDELRAKGEGSLSGCHHVVEAGQP